MADDKHGKNVSKFWIVVCKDLHFAAGILGSYEAAVEAARQATEEGPCVFVPVPLAVQGEVVEREMPAPAFGEDNWMPGGYL